MKNKFFSIFLLILLSFSLISCSESKKSDRIKIVTTIFPQYSFVKEIVGDLCDVEVVLKPGQDSHNFDPSVSTVINIKNADIFVYTSDEMETWAAKLIESLNKNTIVNASKGLEHLIMNEDDHDDHDHPDGEHHHNHSYDPHLWTSIRNSIHMVENITKAICLRDPENSETYKANSQRYISELQEMDDAFVQLFGECSKDNHTHPTLFFVCPFTFYYFIKDYHLNYQALYNTCSSEVEPSANDLINFINLIKAHNVKYIFTKELMSAEIPTKIVEQTNTKLRTLHSGHNITHQEYENNLRYIDIIKNNYEVLKEALHDSN